MTGRVRPVARTRQILKTLLGLMMMAVGCPIATQAATVAGGATVSVVTAGQLVKVNDLRFGLIIPSAAAGTVTINPTTSTRSSTGTLILSGAGYGPADFIALGNPLQNNFLQLVLPPNTTINRVGGGASMTVTNWTFTGSGVSVLNAQGFYQFSLGARLNVGANQPTGAYTGSFTTTVNFF
jgi:Domain of unknown function (DUF4402)